MRVARQLAGQYLRVQPSPFAGYGRADRDRNLIRRAFHASQRHHVAVEAQGDLLAGVDIASGRRNATQFKAMRRLHDTQTAQQQPRSEAA